MPHGNIEQGNEEAERRNQTFFHDLHFFQSYIFRGFCRSCFVCTLQRCAIAAAFHSADDIIGGEGIFIIFHYHAVLQQIYVDGVDAIQFPYCFFYMSRTGGTGHARHIKFLFQFGTPPFISSVSVKSVPVRPRFHHSHFECHP